MRKQLQKSELHPRNRHRSRYDLAALTAACPQLADFVRKNEYGDESIDFFDPLAVKNLNRALLFLYYDLTWWDIPEGFLCPPIPGRADYIHYLADLLAEDNDGRVPTGLQTRILDIGVGANCVYPIIGRKEYGWSFVGSDIDIAAVASAKAIIARNDLMKDCIECRVQQQTKNIFRGIIKKDEYFDAVICNPPFYTSLEEAQAGTMRKVQNLKRNKQSKPVRNFGGQQNELWCEGGETGFVRAMIIQSREFAGNCSRFSSLISKQETLPALYHELKSNGAADIRTIKMSQGSKVSRIISWKFQQQLSEI